MKARVLFYKWKSGDLLAKEVKMTDSFNKKCFTGKSLINEEAPTVVMSNKRGKHLDFVSGDSSLCILSNKAKIFFEEHIKNTKIEFVPVNVSNYNGKEKFWILNILEILKCFDWEGSDYTLFEELGPKGDKIISDTSKILFKDDKIGQREIFHSYEFPIEIYVSREFEEKTLTSDLIGYNFYDRN